MTWINKKKNLPEPIINSIPRVSVTAIPRVSSVQRVEVPIVNRFISHPPELLSPSPSRPMLQRISILDSSIGKTVDSNEKQALYSQIRQLRSSVIKSQNEAKELGLYKQEMAVLENEKLRTSLNYNRIMKEKEDVYEKLKISEDRNFMMREALEELNAKLLTCDKTIVDLEDLVTLKTQEKVDIEIEVKQLRERLNSLETLNITQSTSFSFKMNSKRKPKQ